jgi:hypothetical protein
MARPICLFVAALIGIGALSAFGAGPPADLITVDHYVRVK